MAIKNAFQKFVWGIIALVIVAVSMEVIFHFNLSDQKKNSHIVNIAGRQRMLSQRLVKLTLFLNIDKAKLETTINLLKNSHQELKNYPNYKNKEITKKLEDLDHELSILLTHANCFLENCTEINGDINLKAEKFLVKINQLVFDMAANFENLNSSSVHLRWALFLTLMLIIVYEMLYVLLPYTKAYKINADELKQLKKNMEQSAKAIDQFAIIAKTDAKGKITYANDQLVSISGYERDELIGQDHRILNSGHHSKDFFASMWKKINSGKAWRGTIKNVSKFGFPYWVDTTIVPTLDAKGEVTEFTAFRYDITYVKEAEIAQRRLFFTQSVVSNILALSSGEEDLNTKLDKVLHIILDIDWLAIKKVGGIFTVEDNQLKLVVENQLAPALLTKCAKVDFGTCLCGRAALQQQVIHASCVDERHEITFEGIKEHGHYSVPFVFNGKTLGVVVLYLEHGHQQSMEEEESLTLIGQAVAQLIYTEKNKKELEEQKLISQRNAKLASIGNLAAGVGHEINNPLAAIVGHLDVIKKKESNDVEKIKERVVKIEKATKRIVNIVQGLRTFSRQEKEVQLEKDNSSFSLYEAIAESISLLEDLYTKSGVQIDIEFRPEFASALCLGDGDKFQQIIVNLLSNAKDALEGREDKRIFIQGNIENSHAVISVIDNGTGIPDDVKEKIFDPFFTTKDPDKGTGIGLSLVYKLISEDYQGLITVDNSKKYGGAEFKITVPITSQEEMNVVEQLSSPPLEKKQSEVVENLEDLNLRALVVDDEEDIRELISMILEGFDIEVTTAENGKEALDIYTANPDNFDVILSDMKMPVMDGPTFITNLRIMDIKQPKFLFITGGIDIDFEDKNNKINQLLDGYLYKPFTDEDIEKALLDIFNYGQAKKSA